MSEAFDEFGDLLDAYNEANEKWEPIQKANEFLDSVDENKIWEERHAAADALFTYIAELEAERARAVQMVERLIEAGKNAFERDGGGYERGGWHELVAKWKAQQ
jgi:tryptophan 2,3-dioxygenase